MTSTTDGTRKFTKGVERETIDSKVLEEVCISYLELWVDHPDHVEVQRVQCFGSVQCDDSSPSNLLHQNLFTAGGTHPLQTQQLNSSV